MPVFKSIQNSPETVAIALSGNYNRKRGGSNDYRHPVEDKKINTVRGVKVLTNTRSLGDLEC